MPELVAIRSELFPELRDGLLREFAPHISPTLWERAFLRESSPDEPLGYALRNDGTFVGLLGMIFSHREIDGRAARFCNLHTWYVQPEHRTSSLALLRPLARMHNDTITDLTATPEVRAISERLGFQELDRAAIVMRPLLWAGRTEPVELLEVEDDSPGWNVLSPAERRISRDHRAVDCGNLVARDEGGYCYLVYSRITHGRFPRLLVSCQLHHVSNKQFFARHHAALRKHLLRQTGAQCVVVDSRLMAGAEIPHSWRLAAIPKIYRSRHLRPGQIDTLYSELAFFKFSTLSSFRSMLQSAATWRAGKLLTSPAPTDR